MSGKTQATVSRGAAIERMKKVSWEGLPNNCLEDMLNALFKQRRGVHFQVLSGSYQARDNHMLDGLDQRWSEDD